MKTGEKHILLDCICRKCLVSHKKSEVGQWATVLLNLGCWTFFLIPSAFCLDV